MPGRNTFFSERDEQDLHILSIIAKQGEPVGSGTICEELGRMGYQLSEATIGRLLRQLDVKRYTVKVSNKGRILTAIGEKKLQELQAFREQRLYHNELANALQVERLEELMDILIARRAIEGETAKLAASLATPEDIAKLMEIMDRHESLIRQGLHGHTYDSEFHKTIAALGRNRVLIAALEIIWEGAIYPPVLEHIRLQLKRTIVADHRKVVEAIARRDGEAARLAMVTHIENVIDDVKRYWGKEI